MKKVLAYVIIYVIDIGALILLVAVMMPFLILLIPYLLLIKLPLSVYEWAVREVIK